MKRSILLVLSLVFSLSLSAQIYMADNCIIGFFSASPLENIEATNKAAKPIMNTSTGDIQVKIAMTAFSFDKPLMQEHFNENYVESEKYPYAIYKGKINETIDWTKDGSYTVTVTGMLNMHGVEKEMKLTGTAVVKGDEITLDSKFKIHIADYNIKVPSLYIQNIAEDVDVTVKASLKPFKKK